MSTEGGNAGKALSQGLANSTVSQQHSSLEAYETSHCATSQLLSSPTPKLTLGVTGKALPPNSRLPSFLLPHTGKTVSWKTTPSGTCSP